MPGLVLAETLQYLALWETTGKVAWSDAHRGFPLNQH